MSIPPCSRPTLFSSACLHAHWSLWAKAKPSHCVPPGDYQGQLLVANGDFFYSVESKSVLAFRDAFAEVLIKNSYLVEEEQEKLH